MFDEYQNQGSVLRGILFTLAFHLLQLPMAGILALVAPPLALAALIFFGVSQCVYMIPAILYFRRNGQAETAKGLIIGASVSFLLNATCTAIVFGSFH